MKPEYIEITSEIKNKIKSEIERTGFAPQRVLKGHREAKEIGLNSGLIYSWIRDKSKTGKKAQVELALRLWDDVPNKEDREPPKKLTQYQKARNLHRNALLEKP